MTECGTFYGTGHAGATAVCRRPEGHPSIAVDRIGHSPHPIGLVPTEAHEPTPDPVEAARERVRDAEQGMFDAEAAYEAAVAALHQAAANAGVTAWPAR